mmetsp:Transcript_31664/g.82776  ORF Transcript_31664/g.82776 Transcript_31664/m.82776 type:complete len:210 (-) Transcript_31664:333-962(-)
MRRRRRPRRPRRRPRRAPRTRRSAAVAPSIRSRAARRRRPVSGAGRLQPATLASHSERLGSQPRACGPRPPAPPALPDSHTHVARLTHALADSHTRGSPCRRQAWSSTSTIPSAWRPRRARPTTLCARARATTPSPRPPAAPRTTRASSGAPTGRSAATRRTRRARRTASSARARAARRCRPRAAATLATSASSSTSTIPSATRRPTAA